MMGEERVGQTAVGVCPFMMGKERVSQSAVGGVSLMMGEERVGQSAEWATHNGGGESWPISSSENAKIRIRSPVSCLPSNSYLGKVSNMSHYKSLDRITGQEP